MSNIRVLTARPHRLLMPIIAQISELHQNGESSILMVPEQFTLQAERELIDRLTINGMFDIEVISPTRLKRRVIETTGTNDRLPLSTAGQQMAISLALETCSDRLSFYQASASRRGFANKLSALMTDMKRGGLLPEQFTEYSKALQPGMIKEKVSDIAFIYEAYENILSDKFFDSDDLNRFISERMRETDLIKGKHVFVYGFDSLAENMIVILTAIAKQASSLTIGLISDGSGAPDERIYLPVRRSIARLRESLNTEDLGLQEIKVEDNTLYHASPICHLDQYLYTLAVKQYGQQQDTIHLSEFNSPFEEAVTVTRQIMKLCEQGINIERIAVMYPDQNGYPFAVSSALKDSGLPFYSDEKLPASSHGLPRFLIAALRAITDGYKSEDVLSMMKTGYAPISFEDTCLLENYAREYGIQRKRWLKPFQKGDEELQKQCESLRQSIINPLIKARESLVKAKTTTQSLQAIIDLLTEVNAYDTLKTEEDRLIQENMLMRAGQNSQVWQTILELFDQLYILSNGRRIALKYITERFESGFSAISLGTLPPAANMLHIGVLGHYLSADMDAVFLLGLNDGILTHKADGLLTEDEKLHAEECTNTHLGMTNESRLLLSKLDIKRAMTLAKDKLYLSYARTDPSGNTLQPLDLISDFENRMFKELPSICNSVDELPISAQQAMIRLSDILRDYADGAEETLPDVWKERLAGLLASPVTVRGAIQLMHSAGFRIETLPLDSAVAQKLFGDRTLSVSRLEEFALCSFKHFIKYGLIPEEIQDWSVNPLETGIFFHNSLQRFAQLAAENHQFPDITEEQARMMAEASCAPFIEEIKKGPMGDGPRNGAALVQAQNVLGIACATVTKHLAAGQFKILQTEAKFGYPGNDSFPPIILSLQNGAEITLHGRIDRIDKCDTNNDTYMRVIDYKSGQNTSLDPAALWYGTQLQLMLYLDAVTENAGTAKPAGAFYFHLFDPLSKADNDNAEAVADDIQKQLQMDGVAVADPVVLKALDTVENPISMQSVMNKNGTLRNQAKALSSENMYALMQHTRSKSAEFAQDMLDGTIDIQPVKQNGKHSCDYCNYRSICGYDPLARGAKEMDIGTLSMEELTERLNGNS